jgi:hypothetical protein
MMDGSARLDRCGRHIQAELNTMHTWYIALGDAFVNDRSVPPAHLRDPDGRRELYECARAAASSGERASKKAALILVFAVQYLEYLRSLETHLQHRANAARQNVDSPRRPRLRHAARQTT